MRWRLAAVLVGFTALVLLVQNIPLAAYLRTVERDRIITALQRDAFTLAGFSVAALTEDSPTPQATLATLDTVVDGYSRKNGARVIVVDQTGVAIASSEGRTGQSYLNRPEVQEALSGTAVSGTRASQTLGEDLIYVAVPVGPARRSSARSGSPTRRARSTPRSTVASADWASPPSSRS